MTEVKNRALVTGGAGFIGSNLVHELHARGWRIDVVDDLSNGHVEFLEGLPMKSVIGCLLPHLAEWESDTRGGDTVLFIEADFESDEVLARVAGGNYDVVFHLAANPRVSYTVEQPAATTDVNCTRTLKLLEAIRSAPNTPRFVFSSTSAVYGDSNNLPTVEKEPKVPLSPYGLQKLFIEEYLRIAHTLHGVDSVCLRYANVYGPRQLGDSAYATAITAWCSRVKDGTSLRSDGDGEQSRDLIYVSDVVEANILAATSNRNFGGKAFNIGSGVRVTNNKILSMFRKKFGDLQVTHAPPRPGDTRHTQLSCWLACHDFGYSPKVSFEEGLERTWKWWGFDV